LFFIINIIIIINKVLNNSSIAQVYHIYLRCYFFKTIKEKIMVNRNFKLLIICAILFSVVAVDAMPSASRITLPSGRKIFVSGMNLAWIQYAGDVGDNALNETAVNSAMKAISDSGANCMRIWLSTDGTNDPKYGSNGLVSGPGSKTLTNIQKMLSLAKKNNLLVMPVLLTHNWVKKDLNPTILANNKKMLTTEEGLQAYIDNYLIPIVKAIGNDSNLICWEVYNEPEGMVQGWSSPQNTITKAQVQKSVNWIAAAIHDAVPNVLVSNGAASMEYVNWYTDSELKKAGSKTNGTLDFYMAHFYGWNGTSNSPFAKKYSVWGFDKPLVIGEYPSSDWSPGMSGTSSPITDAGAKVDTLMTYLNKAGYAGGLGWQYQPDQGDPWLKGFTTFGHSMKQAYRADSNSIKLTGMTDNTFLVMASAGNGGKVISSATGRVESGASVTINATANDGYTFSGWTGDTTSTEAELTIKSVKKDWSILANFVPDAGTNLIAGGDFSDDTKWSFYAATDNTASVAYDNDQAKVTITKSDTLSYHIQLTQGGIALDSGVTYVVSFDAWSSAARDMAIGLSTAATWHFQGGANFSITDTKATYTADITPDSTTDAGILQFNCGNSKLPVYIDNVSFVKKAGSPVKMNRSIAAMQSGMNLLQISSGLQFAFESGKTDLNRISVYRANGSKVLSINSNTGIIERKYLTSGQYFIRATNGKSVFNRSVSIY